MPLLLLRDCLYGGHHWCALSCFAHEWNTGLGDQRCHHAPASRLRGEIFFSTSAGLTSLDAKTGNSFVHFPGLLST
jgi:hypothetical protein